MSIPVTSELQETIDRLIATGHYANASEVVESAIRRLEEDERKLTWLRTELAKAQEQIDRGETVSYTPDFMDRLIREANERRRAGKPVADAARS